MSKPIVFTRGHGSIFVRMGPFYEADGVTLATSLPEGTQFVIMGINLAIPAPIQRPLQSDRPPMFSGEAGHFWVPLVPQDTDDLRGLAVVWCPDYDQQTDLQILAPGDYIQAAPSPREYYNLAQVAGAADQYMAQGLADLWIDMPSPRQMAQAAAARLQAIWGRVANGQWIEVKRRIDQE